jgi:hypothetical protein
MANEKDITFQKKPETLLSVVFYKLQTKSIKVEYYDRIQTRRDQDV